MQRNHISLCTGLALFDLAAAEAGWENVAQVEIDPFCQSIIRKVIPNSNIHSDVRTFDGRPYCDQIFALSAGFPCQPISNAGRRGGVEDDRYLYPEVGRIIREIRPRWVILENVAGLFSLLSPETVSEMETQEVQLFCEDNFYGASRTVERIQRRVLGLIIEDLQQAGYVLPKLADGTPIVLCIPACAIGAPHRRDRAWIVAYRDGDRKQQPKGTIEDKRGRLADCFAANTQGQRDERETGNLFETDGRQDGELLRKPVGATGGNFKDVLNSNLNGGSIGWTECSETANCREWENNQQEQKGGDLRPSINSNSFATPNTESLQRERSGSARPRWSGSPDHLGRAAYSTLTGLEGNHPAGQTYSRRFGSESSGIGQYWQQHWMEVAAEFCRVDDGHTLEPYLADLRRDIATMRPELTKAQIERAIKKTAISIRRERLKAIGNGIVHQIPAEIFRVINEVEANL